MSSACRMANFMITAQFEAILLDADGVVQRTPADWLERLTALLELDGPTGGELLAALLEAERPSVAGTGEFRDDVLSVLDRWDKQHLVDEVLSRWHDIELDDDVLAVVALLRETGMRCYLATNQQNARASHMRRVLRYDRYFDEQFYSCELGVAKPERAYFTTILDRLGLSAGRVLFIDDNAENVEAARAVGLTAWVYTREPGLEQLRALLAERVRATQTPS